MSKKLWTWLGTPKANRIISVIACIYFSIAAIGGGYWQAANSILMFIAIWSLGYNSREKAQP